MLGVYSSILFIIQSYLKSNCLFLSPKEKLTYKYTKPKYFTHTNFLFLPSHSQEPATHNLFPSSTIFPLPHFSFFLLPFLSFKKHFLLRQETPQLHHHHCRRPLLGCQRAVVLGRRSSPLLFFLCWFNYFSSSSSFD